MAIRLRAAISRQMAAASPLRMGTDCSSAVRIRTTRETPRKSNPACLVRKGVSDEAAIFDFDWHSNVSGLDSSGGADLLPGDETRSKNRVPSEILYTT